MKKYIALLIVLSFILPSCAQEKNKDSSELTSTFFFIRHAEKDRSDKTNRNPELTTKGHERAQHWNDVFKNVAFDAVYSTDYHRTKQTALPTAQSNKLELTIYNPRAIDGPAFIAQNKGKKVLIVGHSNTTPTFVNAILGIEKYEQIDDSNNANLYIVTISSSGEMIDLLMQID